MSDNSLGEMLQSTETASIVATPETAPLEPTPIIDPSVTVDPPQTEEKTTEAEPTPETEKPEATPEQLAQAKRDQDFEELRTHKKTLETDLGAMRTKLNEYGGESHLQIMQPLLKVAAEIPRTEQEGETWAENAWQAVNESLLPAQAEFLRTEAAWGFLRDAKGQRAVCTALYGEKVTPDIIREFVDQYNADPSIMDLLRPEEDADQKAFRLAQAEKDRLSQERIQQLEDQNKQRDDQVQEQQVQQVRNHAAEVGFAPRAEVKKQFGLEFHKNGDTPEVSAFNEMAHEYYDDVVFTKLSNDPEMKRLWGFVEAIIKEKNPQQRTRVDGYIAQVQERTRAICTQVAKKLSDRRKLLSPELSDQARVKDLKDLPANITGGKSVTTTSGDLSDMPNPTTDPRGHAAWVSKKIAEDAARRNTPGVLQAG